MTKKQL